MITLALVASIALQAPAPPPPPRPKLLVLDVKTGDLTKMQAESLTAIVTARAAKYGQVDVTSAQDVRELVSVEAEKQAAGCAGESCLSEIAGAMGAQYVLVTRVSKLGSSYVLSVQLYDAKAGAAAGRETAEVSSVDELLPRLPTVIDAVLVPTIGAARAASSAPAHAAPAAGAPPPVEEVPAGTAKNSDWLLLGIDYLVILLPIPLLIPLAQGLVHLLAAESLVNNRYPYWWAGILAGYGVYLVAAGMVGGGYFLIIAGTVGGSASQNSGLLIGGLLGGLALIGVGVIVGLLEPVAAYFAGTAGGVPLPKKGDKASMASPDPSPHDATPDESPDDGVPVRLALARSIAR